MKENNKIIIISGTSGSGKTTLVNHLMAHKELNLSFSISACSRKKRISEKDGEDYFFLSKEDFVDKINKNEFLEWEEVYPNQFYGTLKLQAHNILDSEKNILFDVDVKGALSIKKYFKNKARTIFIQPPSIEVVKKRLNNRKTESKSDFLVRINKMQQEISFSNKMDYQLINDNLSIAKKEIYTYVSNFLKL